MPGWLAHFQPPLFPSASSVVRKVEAWWRWTQKDSAEDKPPLSPSAYCQARARLDMQTLRLIHGPLA